MSPASGARGRLREARAALLTGLAFIVVAAAIATFALQRERSLLLAQARDDTATLAALFEENTARTFDGVDNALEGISAYVSAGKPPKNDSATRETMRARLRFIPPVRALFVIGPDGFIIHDTDYPKTPDISLADRPYFRQYVENGSLQRAVSEPLQSRSGTGWFVASTRRINGPDGRLAGVAVAAVQLDSIANLYRKLDLRPGQRVSLLRSNGTMIASYPEGDALVGRGFADSPLFSQKLPRQRSGTYESTGEPFGYERVVSYRALETQPLVVVVSTSLDTVLATWRHTAAGAAAALLVLALLTAGTVLFFVQRQHERMRAHKHRTAEAEARAVASANAKFHAFFEQQSMFACVLAPDGEVLEVNRAMRETRMRPAPGKRFWECEWWSVPPSQPALLQQGFAVAAAGDTYRRESSLHAPQGGTSLVELTLSPVTADDGSVLAVAAVCVDITERKHQEETLRRLASDLSDVDRRRGEFLATLSHELRNVLTPVQNCAQILKIAEPGSIQSTQARVILEQQLQQMRRLVDDLLDVSRINSGKVRLALEGIDLRGVLTRAAAAAHSSMERAGHDFELRLPENEMLLHADAARLQQVFTNLLANAAKYTPPGGHVRLRARQEGREAIVEIADDGIGIPVEQQAKVFEMFEQVGDHESRSQGGLGIGLALVQKIVSLHGGHVEVFSDGTGHGSTFTVYLPLADALSSPVSPTPGVGDHASDE